MNSEFWIINPTPAITDNQQPSNMPVSTTAKRFASYIKQLPSIASMDEADISVKFDELEKAAGAARKAERDRIQNLSEEERELDKQRKKDEAAAKRKEAKDAAVAKKQAVKAAKEVEKAEKAAKAAEREAKMRSEKGDEAYEAAKAKKLESLAKAREAAKEKRLNEHKVRPKRRVDL